MYRMNSLVRSPSRMIIGNSLIQEEHLDDDDTPAKKEYTISDRDLSPIILVAEKNSASITYSPVDTVTLKGSSSDITLIRNKRRNNNDRTAEQPKIVGKHKNYFECDVCKNGFSKLQDSYAMVDPK